MKSKLTYLKKLELFKELDADREEQFFAVVDQGAKNHLPQWIQFSPDVLWIKDSEKEKSFEFYGAALEFFLRQGIRPESRLYAFGGGATTDLAGLIAATILKGIDWIAVPTTLTAMVDASLGGQVSINMPQGKDLVGAKHTPSKILICGDFINTLSERELISGKGEIMKYAFLDKSIFELVIKKANLEEIVQECAKFKLRTLEHDPDNQGERVFLSLGHVFAHHFEEQLSLPYGHALIMGLKYLFEIMGLKEARAQWDKMVQAMDLPPEKFHLKNHPLFELKHFLASLEQDKTKSDSKMRIVLVKSVEACYIEEMTLKELKNKIQEHPEFQTL